MIGERPHYAGASVTRSDDERMLLGLGRFVADRPLEGVLDVAIVRSPLAHARIEDIDTASAADAPGVVGVFTAADLVGLEPYPDTMEFIGSVETFALARDRVRYVGSPVAAVVAEDRYLAEDAAEKIFVDYEELDSVVTLDEALAEGATKLFDSWSDNRMGHVPVSVPAVDALFEGARVVRGTYHSQRHAPVPMEPRAVQAEYADGRLTVWTTTQNPHIVRSTLSMVLGLPERDIRVLAEDVGGGFGAKTHTYPEDALIPWLAIHLGRPVRFVEDRREHFMATNHARDERIELEAAIDDDGHILALRGGVTCDVGSGEIFVPGIATAFVSAVALTGHYMMQGAAISVTNVVTNKTPSGAYRGFGNAEGVFAIERLIEKIARTVGRDSVDVRRQMLLSDDVLPYRAPSGSIIDSGSHRQSFELTVEMAGASCKRHTESETTRSVGVGYAAYTEGTAPTYFGTSGVWASHDAASLRIDPDGSVIAAVGVAGAGQGVRTMVKSVVSRALGADRDDVTVVTGDTDRAPYGLGGWGSRSTVVTAGAMLKAAAPLREKMFAIAAHKLEADPGDLEILNSKLSVRGSPGASLSFAEIGRVAYLATFELPGGIDPGLESSATYLPPGLQNWPDETGGMNASTTFANSVHAAVVAVDERSGEVEILDYIVVHDCGPVLDPQIVEGQIHGGVAQGIGGALYEHLVYSEHGQPLVTSFMDYIMPGATEVPELTVRHFETPSPNTAFGLKGVGEAGVIGGPAAIANAVCDALSHYAADVTELPLTPPAVRRLIESACGDG